MRLTMNISNMTPQEFAQNIANLSNDVQCGKHIRHKQDGIYTEKPGKLDWIKRKIFCLKTVKADEYLSIDQKLKEITSRTIGILRTQKEIAGVDKDNLVANTMLIIEKVRQGRGYAWTESKSAFQELEAAKNVAKKQKTSELETEQVATLQKSNDDLNTRLNNAFVSAWHSTPNFSSQGSENFLDVLKDLLENETQFHYDNMKNPDRTSRDDLHNQQRARVAIILLSYVRNYVSQRSRNASIENVPNLKSASSKHEARLNSNTREALNQLSTLIQQEPYVVGKELINELKDIFDKAPMEAFKKIKDFWQDSTRPTQSYNEIIKSFLVTWNELIELPKKSV